MGRLVEAASTSRTRGAELARGGSSTLSKIKEYGERLAKYIPAEVLAFYTGAMQLIMTEEEKGFRIWASGILGGIAWIGTPLLLGLYSSDPKTRIPNQIIGTVAFGIWMYSYPVGIFAEFGLHKPVIAGLALLVFTFGIAFYVPKK